MTTYFVSRHAGAVAWARSQDLSIDRFVSHLDVDAIREGDQVIGTLPVHVAAKICESGAEYLHLVLEMPEGLRGEELSASELDNLKARLERFKVQRLTRDTERRQ